MKTAVVELGKINKKFTWEYTDFVPREDIVKRCVSAFKEVYGDVPGAWNDSDVYVTWYNDGVDPNAPAETAPVEAPVLAPEPTVEATAPVVEAANTEAPSVMDKVLGAVGL